MSRTALGSFFTGLVLVGAIATPAAATPIRWEFHGEVDSTTSPSAEMSTLFPNGGAAVFTVTIDPDAAVPCGPFTQTCYYYGGRPASEFTFEANIAGHNYFLPNLNGGYAFEAIHVSTSGISFDNSLSELLGGDRVGTSPSFGPHALDFGMQWAPGTFDGTSLPTALPTGPADGSFTLYLWTCRDVADPGCVRQDTTVRGTLTSAVAVPEPGTLALVGLGLAGLLVKARRARTRR
jgi:hypothetical protein